jgi:hypothetical protein
MITNLPNLLIVGLAKSGTITLYSILTQYPNVFMSRSKAPRFIKLDKFYSEGLD